MSSILTNSGAIVALQSLKMTNAALQKSQAEISTGKSVANAKDNAGIWAAATVMNTEMAGYKTIQSQLNVGDAIVSTARAGAEKVVELLGDIKKLTIAASNGTSDPAKMGEDIARKFEQITAVVGSTEMNGINLLDSTATTGTLSVMSSLKLNAGAVQTIDVANEGLDTAVTAYVVTDAATAKAALEDTGTTGIDAMIAAATTAAANLGSSGKRIADQSDFVGTLSDSLKLGVGALVDADMEEASARLQALQTQQQLGIQSLSIANQAPQSILALFRG